MKTCVRCHQEKKESCFRKMPIKRKGQKVGWSSRCSDCEKEQLREGHEIFRRQRAKFHAEQTHITCNICQRSKPATDRFFWRWRGRLYSPCKICHRIQVTEYRNSEQGKKATRAYADKQRENSKRWRLNGGAAVQKQWEKNNPDRTRIYSAVRRMRKAGEITKPSECSRCGADGWLVAQVDVSRCTKSTIVRNGRAAFDRDSIKRNLRWLCCACLRMALSGREELENELNTDSEIKRLCKLYGADHGVNRELLEKLVISPAEWNSIHRENERKKEDERAYFAGQSAMTDRERRLHDCYFDVPEPERSQLVKRFIAHPEWA